MKAERKTIMKSSLIKTSVITMLCLAANCAMSMAQSTSTWLGTNGSSWNDPNNWSGNALPASGAIIHFGAAASYTVDRNIASTTNPPLQVIFDKGAESYTFQGNRLRLNTTGLKLINYSGETVTFSSGLEFGSFGGDIITADGDIIVENGITGGNNRVPIKRGIGTLTINGTSNVQLGVYIYAGKLSLDQNAESFGGVNNVVFAPENTSVYEIRGASTGVTSVSKTVLTMNGGFGAASKIHLKSNGGDGVQLNFGNATNAFGNLGGGNNLGGTLNLDVSSSTGNRVTFASVSSNASLSTSGIYQWVTVTDSVGTGFATLTGTTSGTLARITPTTVFDGGITVAGGTNTNYRATGSTSLTANRSIGSITIDAAAEGSISGAFSLTTGGLLMQEGSKDYAITSALLPLTSGRLFIHQYSKDGDLILNGAVHSNVADGFLSKAGPGTLIVGANGRVLQSSATNVQGGRFVLNGHIERSALVRVFDGATLEGSGKIGTQAASAVTIYGGGILAGSTTDSLDITGTLTLDSYSHFEMTLDYAGNDFVDVVGTVTLNSDVNLKLSLASIPVLDESVLLLKGTSLTTEFTTINGLQIGPDDTFSLTHNSITYDFQIFYGDNEVRVKALSAIPEPSAFLLAGVGLAALLVGGWRRAAGSRSTAA